MDAERGGRVSQIRRRAIAGLKAGDAFTVRRAFGEQDVHAFADLTRDFNPVHLEGRFASVKGFAGRICHGLLVGSMLTEIGGQIGWLASGMNFRYHKPVYFGQTITCTLTILEADADGKARAAAVFLNPDDETVLTAELYGILPGGPERRVLEAMIAEGDPTNPLNR